MEGVPGNQAGGPSKAYLSYKYYDSLMGGNQSILPSILCVDLCCMLAVESRKLKISALGPFSDMGC